VTPLKARYLSNLTPLRGIAALLVAVFHFEMAMGRFVPARISMFFEKSYLMVDLFFVMSGFIMLHVYGRSFGGAMGERAGLRKDNLKHFFVARFARTYPLHLFTLLLLVLIVRYLTDWGHPPIPLERPSDILPNVFLLQSFGVCKIYNWNIPSEHQCGVGRLPVIPLSRVMDQSKQKGRIGPPFTVCAGSLWLHYVCAAARQSAEPRDADPP